MLAYNVLTSVEQGISFIVSNWMDNVGKKLLEKSFGIQTLIIIGPV